MTSVSLVNGFTPLLVGMILADAVFAYFCGCFNGSVIVSKYILRDDVRNHGSGNAGLTNFYRTFGGPLTAIVILTDVLKAVVAIELSVWLLGGTLSPAYAKYWAALFCLLGHMFPAMFAFKGGKGVLSGSVIILLMDWRIGLIIWGLFILCFVTTRYVSLGSITGGAIFPFLTAWIYRDPVLIVLGVLCGGLIVWQHRSNIHRIATGTERKFHFHRDRM